MAAVRQLKSGKWNTQIRITGQKPVSITRDTKEEVERELLSLTKSARVNTVEKLVDSYLSEVMVSNGKKRGGYDSIQNRLTVIARNLRTSTLEQITREDVVSYRQLRLNAVKGGTVRLEIQLLSRFLRWARDEKEVACNDVTEGVKLPEPGKAREKIIEPLELKMIINNASDKAKPIIELAYETAMRRNELLAITPNMVDFKNRVIKLTEDQTKNGHARKVPLSTKAVDLLRVLCEGRDKNQRLFTLTPYAITQAFRRSARISKVNDVCFHSLRHTAISNAAEKGLSNIQLMTFSGHRTLAMLQRYTHLKAENIATLLD
ncbi:TPA: site-specific integrase [Klebsiella aerogenes]|nr:site-specific integrase [Klebsiella aerogenes]